MTYSEKLKQAYEAGKDAAVNGANVRNCHFSIFSDHEMTKEWERGNKEGMRFKRLNHERKIRTSY